MGESKIPLFAYVDETGNTGHNIFDEKQPDFFTAALITRGNFDASHGARVAAIASALGQSSLHAKDLGMHRLESVSRDILELLVASKAMFFVSRVEKKYLLVTKMFDSIFDSGENAAMSWHHYNVRMLRLILTFKLSALVEDQTARDFWKCILEPKEEKARAGLVKVCNALLANVDLLLDEKSRTVLSDALVWARDHPESIQIHLDRRTARHGHFPNLVAFSNLLYGLEGHSKRLRRPVARITHDQQSEFEKTLKSFHKLLSSASGDEINWAGEIHSLQAVKGSTFETKEDNFSAGIQIADVVLWLYSQYHRGKPLPDACAAILNYVFANGWESDFSFSGVSASLEPAYRSKMAVALSDDALAANRALLAQYEEARQSSIARYEIDKMPPFLRSFILPTDTQEGE
ncbi:DUF3800 domain-containing protein (plasmid) [Rhizobium leguminosarum bv. trifolii]|uniref:DUF3800 domain-containing protein n=1 Tax=Rhizobium leguminosarum TaxID=384 RepID=UPI00140F6F40|nr:DUF3800 domain-containing protein [Rhizobium leguminosarum]QIO54588.1 DUF3800 domain-containing protein [Rhizobium leguminosarum bv. trifolii]